MTFKGLSYYWGAIAETKRIRAILFAFLPGKSRDKVTLDTCTGWVRHMGRFSENRTYAFVFDARLTKGEAEVLLLDKEKQILFTLGISERLRYMRVALVKTKFLLINVFL